MGFIRAFPPLWSFLYDHPLIVPWLKHWPKLYLAFGRRKLRRALAAFTPDLIVCTQAMPAAVLAEAKAGEDVACPLVAAITDYIPHRLWPIRAIDRYLVANHAAASQLARLGASPEKITVSGIPIHPIFSMPLGQKEARERLGLPLGAPILLISGGSRGLGPLSEAARALLNHMPQATLLVVCGQNERLARELSIPPVQALAVTPANAGVQVLEGLDSRLRRSDGRLKVYGLLSPFEMRELIAASDLLIGKAGGLTTAEALASGVPLVLYHPIGGQETNNAEYLLSQGAAQIARDETELLRQVRFCLDPRVLNAMRSNARAAGRPDSTQRAVEALRPLFLESESMAEMLN